MSFIGELKRRNVIRVGFAYAVIGWVLSLGYDQAPIMHSNLQSELSWTYVTLSVLAQYTG